jgi:hypothetical protein
MNDVVRDYKAQARRDADDWLSDMGVSGPPVPVYAVAAWLGYRVMCEPLVVARAAIGHAASRQIVVNAIREGDRATWFRRQNYSVAHEIYELRYPEVRDENPEVAEAIYQAMASELVLYRPWVRDTIRAEGWELPALVDTMQTSWEATARALVDLADDWVMTVVDNLAVTARVGSEGLRYPRECLTMEAETLRRAYELWTPAEGADEIVLVQAWPVEPAGAAVRRVIGLTWARVA